MATPMRGRTSHRVERERVHRATARREHESSRGAVYRVAGRNNFMSRLKRVCCRRRTGGCLQQECVYCLRLLQFASNNSEINH